MKYVVYWAVLRHVSKAGRNCGRATYGTAVFAIQAWVGL